MKSFIQLVEEFNIAASSIDSRVTVLRSEISTKKNEQAKAAERYRQALLDDAAGTKEYGTAELTDLKQHVNRLDAEIATATERLEMLTAGSETGKKEKLQTLLGNLRTARELELEGLNADIETIQEQARELRAQLTIKIAEASTSYKRAEELLRDLNRAEDVAGIPREEKETTLGIPTSPTLSQSFGSGIVGGYIGDLCIQPREDELKKAFTRGELPACIAHYKETGELVTDDELRDRHIQQTKLNEESELKEKGFIGRLFSR